jgi:hypothetical protein
MTAESTIGNLCGSRIESVIGMTYKTSKALHYKGNIYLLTKPMPSKEKTAVL